MIAYIDSSVLARAYLADEAGHEAASGLLADEEIALITGSWTRIEVTGAIMRACRSGRCDAAALLGLLDDDLDVGGVVTVMALAQADVEEKALEIVRNHGSRAMDAWHLAVASLSLPELVERGEEQGFASRDKEQAAVAEALGFRVI